MTRSKWLKQSPAILLVASIVAGCTTAPIQKEATGNAPPSTQTPETHLAQLVQENPLFALLTAELAAQRGETRAATLAYTEAAKTQQDPELAKRAVEISLSENQAELAYSAAIVWQELAPNNPQAARTVMVLQLSTNRVEEALPALKKHLAELQHTEQEYPGIGAPPPEKIALEMLLRIPNKQLTYNAALELFGNNTNNIDNQILLAQVAHYAEQHNLAILHIQNIIDHTPQERYYLLQAQFMEKRDDNVTAAMQLLSTQADEHLDWFGVRLYLARNHTQLEQWPLAKQRFGEMLQLQPSNTPLHSSLGFILSKMGERQQAEHHFHFYLENTPESEHQNETLIYLTMVDMALKDNDHIAALNAINQAPHTASNLDLQLKKADILEKLGHFSAATHTLEQFKAEDENTAVRLFLAKAQQAENRTEPEIAVNLLEQGLDRYPNQPDLLYERAMIAERQNDLPALEKHLTQLIHVRPDNPHAYNALGYTWADRNIRLDEAQNLIAKASELAPNDPFIMDSLGWIHYRQGDLQQAETLLKKAYTLRPDEEIGLHLIEVLARIGKITEAQTLSAQLQTKYPNSDKFSTLIHRVFNTPEQPEGQNRN